jgi:hypothetical protein
MSHLLHLVVFKPVLILPLILSRDNPNEEQSARGPRPQPLADTADTAKGNAIPRSSDESSNSNGSGNNSESHVNHLHSGSGHDEDGADDDGFVYQDPDADEADDAPQAAAGNQNRYLFY